MLQMKNFAILLNEVKTTLIFGILILVSTF